MMTTTRNLNGGTPRVLLYCIAALLCMSAIALPAMAATWYVDASGAGDFTNIQPAINAASAGDTIFIRAGTYTNGQAITVNTPNLIIQGESAGSVTVIVTENPEVQINAQGTHLENITFQSTIVYVASTNNIIAHNIFLNPTSDMGGLWIDAGSNTVSDNLVTGATGTYSGISLKGTSSTVENNTIRDGTAAGLSIYGSDNTVTKNSFINNAYAGIEIYDDGFSRENNRLYLNTFTGNGVTATTTGTAPPANTYWVSPEPVSYTYNGNTFTGIVGNFWDTDYTGTDTDGNGIGDTAYTVPESLGSDTAPLVESASAYSFGGEAPPVPEFPTMAFPVMVIGALAAIAIMYRRK